MQEKIRELQKANPEWSYDRAYAECQKLPEMKENFAAMQRPEAEQAPQRNPGIEKAVAKYKALVATAVHQRGFSYDDAWAAVRTEEPELYAQMSENDPVKRIKEANGWRA